MRNLIVIITLILFISISNLLSLGYCQGIPWIQTEIQVLSQIESSSLPQDLSVKTGEALSKKGFQCMFGFAPDLYGPNVLVLYARKTWDDDNWIIADIVFSHENGNGMDLEINIFAMGERKEISSLYFARIIQRVIDSSSH